MLITNCNVWIHHKATDMRKSIDGLSSLVSQTQGKNPTNGEVFVFWNRQKDKIKLLYWHVNGFCMLYKRLEKEKFKIPQDFSETLSINKRELLWLLDGLDFAKLNGHKQLEYDVFE